MSIPTSRDDFERAPPPLQNPAIGLCGLIPMEVAEIRERGLKTAACCHNCGGESRFYIICFYRDHVRLYLQRGTEIDDPDHLFGSRGETVRHVKIASPQDVRTEPLAYLVRSAVALSQRSD